MINYHEELRLREVFAAARTVQEFFWGKMNEEAGLEEFKRMFRKRVAKIDGIQFSNPHWKIELKKRLLQTAAIAVNLMAKLDRDEIKSASIHPTLPSNLPEYQNPIKEVNDEKEN